MFYIASKEQKHYVFENLNDQWMGVSLSSQYNVPDGNFLVCNFKYLCTNFVLFFKLDNIT